MSAPLSRAKASRSRVSARAPGSTPAARHAVATDSRLNRSPAASAFCTVFRRWPTMALFGTPARIPTVGFRRLQRLPVRLAPVVVERGAP